MKQTRGGSGVGGGVCVCGYITENINLYIITGW